ncbi:MAG: hypothetical protein RJA67_784 [Bacteroidota bacterium]|jgi:hypothetical protein
MTQFVFGYSNYNKNKEDFNILHYNGIKKLLIFQKII